MFLYLHCIYLHCIFRVFSMATVCGCSLAMLDAGVPLTTPVAGVAMGLILGNVSYIRQCLTATCTFATQVVNPIALRNRSTVYYII